MKFGNLLIAGITTGSIYAMFAVCVSVWYRVSNILNLAVGDFVVHVFLDETRKYYELERLWADVPRIAWGGPEGAAAATE